MTRPVERSATGHRSETHSRSRRAGAGTSGLCGWSSHAPQSKTVAAGAWMSLTTYEAGAQERTDLVHLLGSGVRSLKSWVRHTRRGQGLHHLLGEAFVMVLVVTSQVLILRKQGQPPVKKQSS
jgi:hypothetical protein